MRDDMNIDLETSDVNITTILGGGLIIFLIVLCLLAMAGPAMS